MKQKNLEQYIRLIIESINDDHNEEEEEEYKQQELDALYQKYYDDIFEKNMEEYEKNQIEYDPNSPKRWNLLDHTINLLRKIDQWLDPNFYENHYAAKSDEIQHVLLDELNFNMIGEGAFRKVFSRPDAMFIVKLEKQIQTRFSKQKSTISGTNKIEFNKYFDFGKKYQKENEVFPIINHTTLFPKVYAYDNLDGMWIITEKVIPIFSDNSTTNASSAIKMFKPFFTFLSELFDFLNNNPTFINKNTNASIFEIRPDIKQAFLSSNDNFYLFQQILDLIINIAYSSEATTDLSLGFQNAIINRILASWSNLYTSIDDFKLEQPKNYQLLLTSLKTHFNNLKPTPDIQYICNILRKDPIDDLHIYNIGFRDMKLNPTEPWKNFVILDYAALGGPPQARKRTRT